MTDFLLELRSEEIPARMQARARDDLARLFAAELAKVGLTATATQTYATPRRLALIARDLPDATQAVREEVKGPKAAAPPQALEGFLRKTGLTREQLTERDGVLFAVTERPGRATAAVLAEAIPAAIRAFPWPKAMRWGAASASTESLRWVRPLHGIVALFGEALVPVEIAGVASGYATLGHRFHHPGPITIGSAADYVEKLRACHVLVDPAEREALIRTRADALAAEAGLALVADEGLVAENAGLTEWPVPLLGRFDPAFLDVPPEVIQLTARVNQKYFVCRDAAGKLANAFICTANIDATDGGAAIVEGNRKVLAARLADARFFYEGDLKVSLEDQAKKLDRIVFHEKLGTVADKVDRVAKLACWLVDKGIVGAISSPLQGRGGSGVAAEGEGESAGATDSPSPAVASLGTLSPEGEREELAALAESAARLCKADLVTGMVGEFPELQGLMGGYYAAAQGEDPRVAEAIRDHYKPVGQGDDVPTAPVTMAVSLADKLDTLLGFFLNGFAPTGSRDPYALRRAALSVMSLVRENNLRIDLDEFTSDLVGDFFDPIPDPSRPQPEQAFVVDWEAVLQDPNVRSVAAGGRTTAYRNDAFLFSVAGEFESLQDAFDRTDHVWDGYGHLLEFLLERFRVYLRGEGCSHDLVAASLPVFTHRGLPTRLVDNDFDLVRLLARVRALQAFTATEDGANLLTGYRRAANILKKEGYDLSSPLQGRGGSREAAEGEGESVTPGQPLSLPQPAAAPSRAGSDLPPAGPEQHGVLFTRRAPEGERETALSYNPEPAEAALIAALDSAEPRAAHAVAQEDFEGAMAALASLRAPIDRFFDEVTVNDADPARRAARLALLARMRDAVHAVADFSKIEG